MASLKICTLNVNGIRNNMKRKSLFHKLKVEKYDIVCLQESHVTRNDVDQWEREWGGKIFISPDTNKSKGQAILFNKHFSFDVQCVLENERMLAVNIQLEDKKLHIVNIYAPNIRHERNIFFNDLKTYISKITNENIIVCGDFNCVLNNTLDIVSGGKHNDTDVALFQRTIEELSLIDHWRICHGQAKEYTWSRKTPFTARRLDYIFVNDDAMNDCSDCEIHSVAQSDHRMISIKYRLSPVIRGPSYWKFNDNLLRETFLDKMNTTIDSIKAELSNLDPQVKWDLSKLKIKEFCIAYSKEKKILNAKQEINLKEKLNNTDKLLAKNPSNKELLLLREQIKHKLDLHDLEKAKSAQIRSREKYIVDGEKNTRYFLNLEKARANAKIMDKLKTDNGETLTSQTDILKEQVSFYRKAFSKKDTFSEQEARNFTEGLEIPQITQEQKDRLETNLDEKEILNALKNMKNNSSPGLDGLTTSYIKVFWPRIKDMLIESIRAAYVKGEMSVSQKRAVITLIHKGKGLPRDTLNNWRPISITNTDYKILAKCLANRLKVVIGDIINEDQVGFIKGRKSSDVIRLIDDVIDHMNEANSPGILVALDYSRAFDSISKEFMLWSFKQFGFGENFVKWIHALTTNTESCINYSGWISEEFAVETGIRQGCPFSPLGFILALEILAIKIRNDPRVQGIKLKEKFQSLSEYIIKLAMYADDISIFLRSKEELEIVLNIINRFSNISQLKINKNKTEAMWLGSNKNSMEEYGGIRWNKRLKILGIIFQNDTPASDINENWTKRIEKVETIINRWSKRNLNISGKICIIKSFLISQFIYPMQALSAPRAILVQLNTMLFRFLWKKKYNNTRAYEKVKRNILCNKYEEGGTNMINVLDMQTSFTLSRILELQNDTPKKWKITPTLCFSNLGSSLSCLDATVPSKKYKGLEYIKSQYWKNAFITWLDYKHLIPQDKKNFHSMYIWNNKDIKYHHNSLFIKKWIDAGLIRTKDVWENGSMIALEKVEEKTGSYAALILDYSAVRTALQALVVRSRNLTLNTHTEPQTHMLSAKSIRRLITQDKSSPPCSVRFWLNKYNYTITKEHWCVARISTREERLRLLQWKILHNIYPTQILLHKMKIAETNRCSCGDVDYIEHFFWKCPKLDQFWTNVIRNITLITGENILLQEMDVLFGYHTENMKNVNVRTINHILLIAKMTISKYKYGTEINPICIFENELAVRNLI